MGLKFRRGTNAQKSGSLAFGEPYVNTDLGTLQIGGATGDITLGASGTGSQGSFAGISGSSLDITGNAKIDGNLTLGGNITIGDNTSDTVNMTAALSSSLLPSVTNVFDLGSTSKVWRDLYISTGSIKVVNNGSVVSTLSTNEDGSQTFPNGLYSQANITIGSGSYTSIGKFEIGRRGNTPDNNTVLGIDVMPNLTTGEFNTGLGRGTLYNLTTGGNNIAIGNQAGYSMTNGGGNITIGAGAAFYLLDPGGFNGTPNANTYIGQYTGGNVNSGFYTTAIGGAALIGQDGATDRFIKNTAIGYGAGSYLTGTATNNLYLGANAGPSSYTNENYKFYVSNGDEGDQSFMYGDMSNTSRTLNINASTTISGSATANSFNGIINATNGVVSGSSQLTSSFAGLSVANTFTGNQTITGSLYITNDLVIQGSASIQTISSSRLDIGDNIIQLNVNSPSLRFGGIEINDSGSAGSSGSFLYDSLHDEFIFVHKGNGVNVTSSHFVLGPETYDNLGTETYLTNNRLPKGTGKEHLNDSNITDTGTLITLGSNTTITGTLVASGTTLVSGSSQITYASISSIPAGIVSGSSQVTPLLPSGVVSGSAQTIANLPTGTISGSSQVTLSSTTGGGTSANVRFGSLGIGMAASGTSGRIDAANDVVAFSTSDIRLKENIKPIENALDKISKISGNTYDWKSELKDVHGYDGSDVGVIAQEVEAVLPQLVQDRDNGYKAVKYDKLVALLIEGIKEQQTQIHNLTLEIENLKKNNSL
jgi:hypothetical protein